MHLNRALRVSLFALILAAGCGPEVEEDPLAQDWQPDPEDIATDGAELTPTGTLYVSLSGSDSNPGTIDRPLRTLGKAASLASPGFVVYVRGGTYVGRQSITVNGTSTLPITFRPYGTEHVVFSGQGLSLSSSQAVVSVSYSSFVTVRDFEVASSSGRGLDAYESSDVTFRGNTVHDVRRRCLGGSGVRLRFEGNEVYRCVLENEYGSMESNGGGWAGAVSTWMRADGTRSRDVVFSGNYVHDNWGEGIIALHVDGAQVRRNTVRDGWSCMIYADNASNVRIEKNLLYGTTDRYNRPSQGVRATAIGLAVESYSSATAKPLSDITIANNLVIRLGRGINFWTDSNNTSSQNSYRNLKILYNVVHDPQLHALKIWKLSSYAVAPYGNEVRDNVLEAGTRNGIAVEISSWRSAWTFSHNVFPDGVPSTAAESNSFAADPKFEDPTQASFTGFRLRTDSPLRHAGRAHALVTDDAFSAGRSSTSPSIGLYEAP